MHLGVSAMGGGTSPVLPSLGCAPYPRLCLLQCYWGWHTSKRCQAVWAPFGNFPSSTWAQCLDAAQGADVVVCGASTGSSWIAVVETERETKLPDPFNQYLWILWSKGCFFGWLGTCMQDAFHAKFYEWDSVGTGAQDSLVLGGHCFAVPFLLICPESHGGSSVNPSPQAAKSPNHVCVAYLTAFLVSRNQTIVSKKAFFSLSHSLWFLASTNTGLGQNSLLGWLAAIRDTSQGRWQQGCEKRWGRWGHDYLH